MKNVQKGFTLIELMIVVAIIGILAAIAIPQYSDYTSRTRAAGTVAEIASIKTAVSMCIAETGKIAGCDSGAHGIPVSFIETSNTANDVSVENGVITGTSKATAIDGTALVFNLVPELEDESANMIWEMDDASTICDAKRGLKDGQGGCPL